MSEHPVDHVAAIGAAGGGHSIWIRIRQRRYMVHHGHDIVVDLPAPIVLNVLGEFLSVSVRSSWVWHDDQIPTRGEHLSIPPVRPVLSPFALRSTVNQKQNRV